MNKRIGIIMCTWKRPERLNETLTGLLNQTNKDFSFYIWNNNNEINDIVKLIVNKYKPNLDITIINSEKNVGGFGRFEMAKIHGDKHEIIIFIDDDQDFNNNMVQIFVNNYEPNSIKSRWGWRLAGNNYRQRTKISKGGMRIHYCGTGGMVLPSWVFKREEVFQIPKEFLFVEDLWLSYVCDSILNMNLVSIEDNGFIMQRVDGKDQFNYLVPTKDKFMYYLTTQKGWKFK